MKIAISARGTSPDSEVDERFGRAYWLLIYCDQSQDWDAIDNSENRVRPRGAGIRAAELLIEHGVGVLLTGETGPKAFRTLKAAGISMVHNVSGLVEDALIDWQAGRLQFASMVNDSGSPVCLLSPHLKNVKVVHG